MIEVSKKLITVTGKEYHYPAEAGQNPQIWAVNIRLNCLDSRFELNRASWGINWSNEQILHVDREDLEKAGLMPCTEERTEKEIKENLADLLLRLLAEVGVFPTEDGQ